MTYSYCVRLYNGDYLETAQTFLLSEWEDIICKFEKYKNKNECYISFPYKHLCVIDFQEYNESVSLF